MAGVHQGFQVLQGAKVRVNPIVVGNVVLVIGGAGKNGGEPQALDPQTGFGKHIPVVEIVQSLEDSRQVSLAVSVGIGKGANEDLIEHPVVVVRFVGDNGNRGFRRLGGNRNLRRGGGAPGKGQNKKQSCNAQKDLFHENYLAYPMELSMASSILPQAPFPAPEHFT